MRLNLISHLLSRIPYEAPKREKVKLPKRHLSHHRAAPDYPFKMIAERSWTEPA